MFISNQQELHLPLPRFVQIFPIQNGHYHTRQLKIFAGFLEKNESFPSSFGENFAQVVPYQGCDCGFCSSRDSSSDLQLDCHSQPSDHQGLDYDCHLYIHHPRNSSIGTLDRTFHEYHHYNYHCNPDRICSTTKSRYRGFHNTMSSINQQTQHRFQT